MPITIDDSLAADFPARCSARTDYRGSGPVSHSIRCDLPAAHAGAHELRNRSDGALVTSWTATS